MVLDFLRENSQLFSLQTVTGLALTVITERTVYFELHHIHNLTWPHKFDQKPNACEYCGLFLLTTIFSHFRSL